MDKMTVGDRYINVQLAKGEKIKEYVRRADNEEIPLNCKTVFVKNLPYDVTEEEVGDKFRPCGKIKAIRFVFNTKFGHFKGYIFD